MQATYQGGLTGKARINRHRNRVHRIQAQQMLEEFYDGDEYEIPARPIPLRGRAEFLPTLDSWSQEDAAFETGNQLELTLQAAGEASGKRSSDVADLQLQIAQEANELAEKAASDKETAPAIKVIPAPYWARPRATFQPQGGRGAERNFEFKRFIYGCALGSAAAAAILLAVSTVVH